MWTLLLTCNPGTEDIVYNEAKTKIDARLIDKSQGRIIVEVDENIAEEIYNLRSIHSIYLLLSRGKVRSDRSFLGELKEIIKNAHVITNYITPATTFAVRTERAGVHEYTSLDIARVVGEAIIELVEEKYGQRPRVDLDSPSVILRFDIIFDTYYIGILLSGEKSLHRRGYRIEDHPAALKPSLAYVLLKLSGSRVGDTIMDPMCGCGTIAIEASLEMPYNTIYCMDINPNYIRKARLNALAAGILGIRFIVGDARRLSRYFDPESIDRMITNPPYGIRLSDPYAIKDLYKKFIQSSYEVLKKNGTLTLITAEYKDAVEAGRLSGYEIIHERYVAHGSLWTKIIVFKKT